MRNPVDWDLWQLLAAPDRVPRDADRRVETKLRRLLRHAAATVPWYQRLCQEAGLDPAEAGVEALERLPVTRRDHWREQPASAFHSTAIPLARCHWYNSSGTTGVYVIMPYTYGNRVARRIGTQRCFWASGLGVWDRYAWLRASHRHRRSLAPHERLGLLRTLRLDLLAPPSRWWDSLVAWAPRGLVGFTLETEAVATWVAEGRVPSLPYRPICAVYGEPLEAATRARIEGALGPVRELYGSVEAGTIAWECDRGGGLHVNSDLVIVEFLHDGRRVPPGTPGEVVVTNLHSHAMPVIRYAQGDIGWEIPGPCPCGRPGPLMRLDPTFRLGPFRLPSGRRLAARFFAQTMPAVDWLVRWEATQSRPDALHLVLTVNRTVPAAELRALADTVRRACWEPVHVDVECR